MNKILFVTHESTRTGAPLILLEFIKWLKGNSNFDIFILIVKAGILDDEFKKYGTIINVHELVDTRNKIIFCKLLFRIYNSSLYIRFKEKIEEFKEEKKLKKESDTCNAKSMALNRRIEEMEK